MELKPGSLDAALRFVEEEGYSSLTESERMTAAVEILKVAALRDIANRLYKLEQGQLASLDRD